MSKKMELGLMGIRKEYVVACLRVGEGMPMKYGWFHKSNVVGKTLTIDVPGGSLIFYERKSGRSGLETQK